MKTSTINFLGGLVGSTREQAQKDWGGIAGDNPCARRLRHNRRIAAARRYIQEARGLAAGVLEDAICVLWVAERRAHPDGCSGNAPTLSPLLTEWTGGMELRRQSGGDRCILAAVGAAARLEAKAAGEIPFHGIFVDRTNMDGLDRLVRVWQATDSRRARREIAAAGYSQFADPSPWSVDAPYFTHICSTLSGMWVEEEEL